MLSISNIVGLVKINGLEIFDVKYVNIYNKSIHEHDTSNALCWVLCSFINNFCKWMSLPVIDSILWIQVTECEMMRTHYLGIVMLWSPHWCYCQCIENLLQSDILAPIKKEVLDIARSHSVIGIGLMMSTEWEYPIDGSALLQMRTCVPEAGARFIIKMSSYQYGKSHCGDKTVVRSSYLHNGISYTGKTTYLYWIGALVSIGGISKFIPQDTVWCNYLSSLYLAFRYQFHKWFISSLMKSYENLIYLDSNLMIQSALRLHKYHYSWTDMWKIMICSDHQQNFCILSS